MLNSSAIKFLFCICCLIILISCEKESSYEEEIKNYQETTDPTSSKILDHFFFVGMIGYEVGLYKYNFKNNKYDRFWTATDEDVIQLSYSDNLDYAFFLTARKLGTQRGVSFIRGIKLYSIDLEHSSVEPTNEVGDAVQLSSYWIDNNFKIQLTRFDMKIASHIYKVNQIYSPFGKLLEEDVEIFDFIKDGYPQFEIKLPSLISPSGNFGIMQSADSMFFSISDALDKLFIDSTASKINKIKWSSDERFVFFSTNSEGENLVDAEAHKIYVYDIINQKVVMKLNSESKMNFVIANDLLIFDTKLNSKSAVGVFNYRKNEDVITMRIKGGCGIINIL